MSGIRHSRPRLTSGSLIHMSQSQVLSGVGHLGSSSPVYKLLFNIQPRPCHHNMNQCKNCLLYCSNICVYVTQKYLNCWFWWKIFAALTHRHRLYSVDLAGVSRGVFVALVIPRRDTVQCRISLENIDQLREVREEVWRHIQILLQNYGVLGIREDLEGWWETWLVVLRDASIPHSNRSVLNTSETKQLRHSQRFIIEPVNEHSDHVWIGSISWEQRSEHPVEIVRSVAGDDCHWNIRYLVVEDRGRTEHYGWWVGAAAHTAISLNLITELSPARCLRWLIWPVLTLSTVTRVRGQCQLRGDTDSWSPVCEALWLFVSFTHCLLVTLDGDHGPHVSPANAGSVFTAQPPQQLSHPGPQLEAALVLDSKHQDPGVRDQTQEESHGVIFIRRVGVKHSVRHHTPSHLVQHQNMNTSTWWRVSITVNLKYFY